MQPSLLTEICQDRSREFYRAIVGSSTDLVTVLDEAFTFTFVGDSVTAILGYTPGELLGGSAFSLLHPDDLQGVQGAFQEILAYQPSEFPAFRIRHKNGEWRWLECTARNMLQDEHVRGILATSRDLTAALQFTHDSAHHQVFSTHLFAEHPFATFTMDLDGLLKKMSGHVQRLTGFTAQEMIGQPYYSFLHPDSLEPAAESMEKVWTGETCTQELCLLTKEGETRHLRVSVMPVYFGNELRGARGIARDITEAVNARQLLLKLADDVYKHNLDLQQFTYMVSHNLRAPVANALGLAQLANKLPKDTDSYDAAIERLHATIEQLDAVVRDINEVVSLRENGRLSRRGSVSLGQVCGQVLEQLAVELQQSGAQVKVEIDPSYRLLSIQTYLYSILHHLISNSLKYRSEHRQLELTIRAERDQRGFVLSVRDNGSGMDLHLVRHQLFQLYKRFHPNTHGKGIGLFLVKTQVQALGGKIEVESAPDEGTTFKIYLGAKHV